MADYDGTLAAFRKRREEALPDRGVVEGLARVTASGTRLVIISGREAGEVARLLAMEGRPEIRGCHGAEKLTAAGTRTLPLLTEEEKDLLDEAARTAEEILPPEALEVKPLSVAGHFRGLAEETALRLGERLRKAWQELPAGAGELRAFDGGLELRLKRFHKGLAVASLLEEEPTAAAAYLGDDETDEDAFRALNRRGLALLVAEEDRPTSADGRIRREAIPLLLREWAEVRERREKDEG
jgi:trehalose 6-phosphate phosphatase